MASLNRVLMIGRLCKDPQIRTTPGGATLCEMRLATTREWTDYNGDRQSKTCFVTVVAWKRQAETCKQYLSKGREIFVEGYLDYDEWEDDDGKPRSRYQITARSVQFLGQANDSVAGEDPDE